MSDLFIGRQPIFDRKLKVIGYELLYRNCQVNNAAIKNEDSATSRVILNTFIEFGLSRLVGTQSAFINLTRNFFTSKIPIPVPPHQLVFEVLENITIDDKFIQAIRELHHKGYRIALDDVVIPAAIIPLLQYSDILKIDIRQISPDQLAERVHQLRKYPVKLLAEKVETPDEYDFCRKLGFDYFQGYFLCKPKIIEGREIPPNRLTILRMVATLQNPEVDFKHLEEIISQDVSLGYKLLRLANSAFYGVPTRVKSIRQAMTLIGLKQLRSWLTLFLMTEIDNKPSELSVIAMVRAKMCELISQAIQKPAPETYFLVGLFSVLDAFFDLPMPDILATLPLSTEINQALIEHTGDFGVILHLTLEYEKSNWDEIEKTGIPSSIFRDSYIQAVDWATLLTTSLIE